MEVIVSYELRHHLQLLHFSINILLKFKNIYVIKKVFWEK